MSSRSEPDVELPNLIRMQSTIVNMKIREQKNLRYT